MKKVAILFGIFIVSLIAGVGLGFGIGALMQNTQNLVDSNEKNNLENNENAFLDSGDKEINDFENNLNTDIDNSNEYIFANSDKELLREEEVKKLSKENLELAKNEIFARYGYDFSSKSLQEYFGNLSWYKKIEGKKISVTELNEIEQQNVVLLDKYIQIRINDTKK